VDNFLANPILTIPNAQHLLGMSYHGAQRVVEKLLAPEILEPWDIRDYGKSFVARKVLNILLGEEHGG
jgi:Fic family protein